MTDIQIDWAFGDTAAAPYATNLLKALYRIAEFMHDPLSESLLYSSPGIGP